MVTPAELLKGASSPRPVSAETHAYDIGLSAFVGVRPVYLESVSRNSPITHILQA